MLRRRTSCGSRWMEMGQQGGAGQRRGPGEAVAVGAAAARGRLPMDEKGASQPTEWIECGDGGGLEGTDGWAGEWGKGIPRCRGGRRWGDWAADGRGGASCGRKEGGPWMADGSGAGSLNGGRVRRGRKSRVSRAGSLADHSGRRDAEGGRGLGGWTGEPAQGELTQGVGRPAGGRRQR